MEKDNSNSKSSLQIQREKLNEEFEIFTKAMSEGMGKIRSTMWVKDRAVEILNKYYCNPFGVKESKICTEKKFEWGSAEFPDNCPKEVFIENQKMLLYMSEKLKCVVEYINQEVSGYTFYVKTMEIKPETRLTSKHFVFCIDIK